MNLPSRFVAAAGALCLATIPAYAIPIAGFGTFAPFTVQRPASPMVPICHEPPLKPRDSGEGTGGGSGTVGSLLLDFNFAQSGENIPIQVECDGSGASYDDSGPGYTNAVIASIEKGTVHCGQYTDVWRIDCISDELERMAQKMPRTNEYSRAKSEILAASARLHALAVQNADPAKPAVRRAAKVGNTMRTTTRPITAVAPDRVAATNRAANAVIAELSTTLLRSAPNSATATRELTRVAQAVDSTKVLLRST